MCRQVLAGKDVVFVKDLFGGEVRKVEGRGVLGCCRGKPV